MTAPRVWLFADYNQAESRVVAWKGPVPKLKQWYSEGVDVHVYVCRLIARTIQENKIQTPMNVDQPLFKGKHWQDFGRGDEEREISKRTVHAYNYGMGAGKFAIITGLTEEFATILLKIYSALFPEIRSNYHTWVESCIRKNRTIWMPEPVRFRKVFYDIIDDELMRSAYSCYPQCTVASMLNRTIATCCNIFRNDVKEELKDQWKAWYGEENWSKWCHLRDKGTRSPNAILWGGMDVRLNVHDAGGISLPDDSDLVQWVIKIWRETAETPIHISETERLVIPVDFKIGKTWGADDLKELKA
jgi:hypothetical protein